MSAVILAAADDAARWHTTTPDGSIPSPALRVEVHEGSLHVTANSDATGHAMSRSIGPVDVTGMTEIRLPCRGDRRAVAAGAPLGFELRLGSAALPSGDPANTWHRLLPVAAPGSWEIVRLGLDDLPAEVATAVTGLELVWRGTDRPTTTSFGDVLAVRPQMLADADAALVAALTGVRVAGAVVPVVVLVHGEDEPPSPALTIRQVDVRYAPARADDRRLQRDFTRQGHRTALLGDPFDVDYEVRPAATTRAAQAELLEAVVERLGARRELASHGERLPAELVWLPDRVGGAVRTVPVLHYRVGVRAPVAAPAAAHPVSDIGLRVDHREAG
ncbi:hypothetical protein ACI780_06920 [Geodermatophilus sp. SYSU D00814]